MNDYPKLRMLDGQIIRQERAGDSWKALDDAAANEQLRRLDGAAATAAGAFGQVQSLRSAAARG
jgi:hypothetical protein